jgi:aryl-alcohol dehydrogenase
LDGVGAGFSLQEVTLDDPRPDEVVVRIVAAGVCGTDVHVQHGGIPFPLPGVVGHEGAGIVERVGSAVTSVALGDRVLLTFTSCGACRNCRLGHPAYCLEFLGRNLLGGRRADGSATLTRGDEELNAHFFAQSSFSTVVLADERGVTRVSPDADLELLAPLGCGVQTGAGAVLNVLRPEPGTTLVVFGAGAVGLSAAMAARLTPATAIVVVDIVPSRLELALEVGATHVVNSQTDDVAAVVEHLTAGRGADYAIDATGVAGVVELAASVVTPLGTVASIGAPPPGVTAAFDVNHWLNGRRFVGVTEGDSVPQVFLPALVDLVQQGRIPLHKLVEHYPFDRINDAAAAIRDGTVVKPVLRFP